VHTAQAIATLVLTGALALFVLALFVLAAVALRGALRALSIVSETADLIRSLRVSVEQLTRPAATAARSLAHVSERVDEVASTALDAVRRLLFLESAAEDQVARMLFGLLSLFEAVQAVLAQVVQGRVDQAESGTQSETGEGEAANVR
jgi:hypothetical protein